MKFFLALVSFAFLLSCNSQKATKYSVVEYEAGPCFGFCPIFKMKINPDHSAIIEAERFTFTEGRTKDDGYGKKEGTFKATVKNQDYQKLISLLDAANLKSLKNKYGNHIITDLPTAHLTVQYTDGSTKKIEDYGKGGTEKLSEIYQFLEDLRKTQTWTKVQ